MISIVFGFGVDCISLIEMRSFFLSFQGSRGPFMANWVVSNSTHDHTTGSGMGIAGITSLPSQCPGKYSYLQVDASNLSLT